MSNDKIIAYQNWHCNIDHAVEELRNALEAFRKANKGRGTAEFVLTHNEMHTLFGDVIITLQITGRTKVGKEDSWL